MGAMKPSRARVLRRIGWWVGVPLLVLVGVRVVWGWEAERRLEGTKEGLRKQGLALSVEEFTGETPEGVLGRFEAAAEKLSLTRNESDALNLMRHRRAMVESTPTEEEWQTIEAVCGRYKDLVREMEAIEGKPAGLSRKRFEAQTNGKLPIPFAEVREYQVLLYQSGMLALRHGEEGEALNDLRLGLEAARLSGKYPLAASGVISMDSRLRMCEAVLRIETILMFKEADSRTAARRLIRALLDEEFAVDVERAWRSELVTLPGAMEKDKDLPRGWWIAPFTTDATARTLQYWSEELQGIQAPNYPTAKRRLPPVPDGEEGALGKVMQCVDKRWEGNCWLYALMKMRCLTDGRAAAMLLAARLRVAEEGITEAASALVPNYLREVPADPFSEGGTLRYRLDREGPTVWSVGPNGTDEGGLVKADLGKVLDRYGREQVEVVFGGAWREAIQRLEKQDAK